MPFAPYAVLEREGIRIGVLGLITPNVPGWEKPENYRGLVFEPMDEAARRCAAAARPIDDVRASAAWRRHVIGVLARDVTLPSFGSGSEVDARKDGSPVTSYSMSWVTARSYRRTEPGR